MIDKQNKNKMQKFSEKKTTTLIYMQTPFVVGNLKRDSRDKKLKSLWLYYVGNKYTSFKTGMN